MIRKMVIGIFGILLMVVSGLVWALFPSANKVLRHIENHPESSAFFLQVNQEPVARLNPDQMLPLASVVKIIIAIEYAEQAAAGEVDPDALIALSELEKYYVPKTDGGAHAAWLKNYSGRIEDGKISLRRIAKGMIAFSSNANTEYLQQLLGIERINKRLELLGVSRHSDIYYLVSSMFVADEMVAESGGDTGDIPTRLGELSDVQYAAYIAQAHQKLVADATHKSSLINIGLKVQKVWSDRLPASTVQEYISIVEKINQRNYFDKQVQVYLHEVMETIMENPANRKWLAHSGQKGGSTATVLTKALYATLKEGDSIELAYFMNDLGITTMPRLSLSLNAFELKLLTDKQFREDVIKRIENIR